MQHNLICSNITSMCCLAPNTPGCKGRNWQFISLQLSSAWAGNASQVLLQLFLQHANTVVLAFGNIWAVWRIIWKPQGVKRRKVAGKGWTHDMDQHGNTLAGQHKHLNVQGSRTDEAARMFERTHELVNSMASHLHATHTHTLHSLSSIVSVLPSCQVVAKQSCIG